MPSKSTLEYLWDDFRSALSLGYSRGQHLLTAGESVVVLRILNLHAEAGQAYSWLIQRKPDWFFEPELQLEAFSDWSKTRTELAHSELVDSLVPWSMRASSLPSRLLRAACADLELPKGGSKTDLCARLASHTHWIVGEWIRPRHRKLVERLLRFATLRVRPDLAQRTLDRLYDRKWPTYDVFTSINPFPKRDELLAWEALVNTIDTLDLETIQWLLEQNAGTAPGRLNRTRALVKQLKTRCRDAERADAFDRAAMGYQTLMRADPPDMAIYAVRYALCLEHQGLAPQALNVLRTARATATGPDRLRIQRTARRLARAAGQTFGPDRPLKTPALRSFTLAPGPQNRSRPTYITDGHTNHVERAIIVLLARHGRRAIRSEGRLWTTIFSLMMAKRVSFLPLPDQLPIRGLAAPIDLGTPHYYIRRMPEINEILEAIRRGQASELLRESYQHFDDIELGGVDWNIAPMDTLCELIDALPTDALLAILERLLVEGWRAARGLPDLVVLPGDPISLPSFPKRLGPQLHFVEVKGPTDRLSDEQKYWLNTLISNNVRSELWQVSARTE